MKLLIIGHKRHGKDTLAEILNEFIEFKFESSSKAALNIFLFDVLNKKYGANYLTKDQAFEDRVNCRDIWFNEIEEYNKDDKARLAKEILKKNDVYVGMRSEKEIVECKKQNVFDLIIGIYNYRKDMESKDSMSLDMFEHSDIIITNNGTIQDLKDKVDSILMPVLFNHTI